MEVVFAQNLNDSGDESFDDVSNNDGNPNSDQLINEDDCEDFEKLDSKFFSFIYQFYCSFFPVYF